MATGQGHPCVPTAHRQPSIRSSLHESRECPIPDSGRKGPVAGLSILQRIHKLTAQPQTIAELLHRATQLKVPPLTVVERIIDGKIPDIKPPVKKKLASFADALRDLRRFAREGMSPTKLITALVELIQYGEHLRKTQPDHESRWENVQELMNFASEVENSMPAKAGKRMLDAEERAHEELWGDGLGEWDADQVEDAEGCVCISVPRMRSG